MSGIVKMIPQPGYDLIAGSYAAYKVLMGTEHREVYRRPLEKLFVAATRIAIIAATFFAVKDAPRWQWMCATLALALTTYPTGALFAACELLRNGALYVSAAHTQQSALLFFQGLGFIGYGRVLWKDYDRVDVYPLFKVTNTINARMVEDAIQKGARKFANQLIASPVEPNPVAP